MINPFFHKTTGFIWFAVTFFAVLFLILLIASLSGCDQIANMINTKPHAPTDEVAKIIYKTNWMVTISMLGIALSVAALVQGSRIALPLFAGCATLLTTVLTVAKYAQWISLVGLLIAVGVFVYVTIIRRKEFSKNSTALKEVVTTVQKVRDNVLSSLGDEKKEEIKRVLCEQSYETSKIVKKIKENGGSTNGKTTTANAARGVPIC
jgi:uncharacterized protein YceK